jgi:hypothetical protein
MVCMYMRVCGGVKCACAAMARLLTIDDVTVGLRNALLSSLRAGDEAILLPQANQSSESGIFKNVAFQLDGQLNNLSASVFSPDWFTGISILNVRPNDHAHVLKILDDAKMRNDFLKKLTNINSELFDSSIEVGPSLECDELDRDVKETRWSAGFDSASCFVGLFCAENSRVPEGGTAANKRVFKEFYLACRAGGGVAASTFHARLVAGLSSGSSLDDLLESDIKGPGTQALRRVASASSRNRRRILHEAATALGLKDYPEVGDAESRNLFRTAVPDVEIMVNSIRKLDVDGVSRWQYTTGVDSLLSKGLATLSNPSDGITLFSSSNGDLKLILKNKTWQSIPFSTKRLLTSRAICDEMLKQRNSGQEHLDYSWINTRFIWKNRIFRSGQVDFVPFALHGSHDTENYIHSFSRELGLSDFTAIRLRPELVFVAGVEPGKLRALVKAV